MCLLKWSSNNAKCNWKECASMVEEMALFLKMTSLIFQNICPTILTSSTSMKPTNCITTNPQETSSRTSLKVHLWKRMLHFLLEPTNIEKKMRIWCRMRTNNNKLALIQLIHICISNMWETRWKRTNRCVIVTNHKEKRH